MLIAQMEILENYIPSSPGHTEQHRQFVNFVDVSVNNLIQQILGNEDFRHISRTTQLKVISTRTPISCDLTSIAPYYPHYITNAADALRRYEEAFANPPTPQPPDDLQQPSVAFNSGMAKHVGGNDALVLDSYPPVLDPDDLGGDTKMGDMENEPDLHTDSGVVMEQSSVGDGNLIDTKAKFPDTQSYTSSTPQHSILPISQLPVSSHRLPKLKHPKMPKKGQAHQKEHKMREQYKIHKGGTGSPSPRPPSHKLRHTPTAFGSPSAGSSHESRCRHCDRTYPVPRDLRVHEKSCKSGPGPSVPCTQPGCDKMLSRGKHVLTRHMFTVHKIGFKCSVEGCLSIKANEDLLKVHISEGHRNIPCGAEGCSSTFWNQTKRSDHLALVHGEGKFSCGCGHVSGGIKAHEKHLREAWDKDKHDLGVPCPWCEKRSKDETRAARHVCPHRGKDRAPP